MAVSSGVLGDTFPLNLYYAYGIRNSFGIDFDPITGILWDTENGPEYGDEINLVKEGFNSGWIKVQGIWKPVTSSKPEADLVAGDQLLKTSDLVDFGGKGHYSAPEFIWKKTVGPTSLKFFHSDKLGDKYKNDLFVANFNLGTIFHFDLTDDRTHLSLTGRLADKIADSNEEVDQITFGKDFGRVTDMEVGPDGNLYVLTYQEELVKIYKITMIGNG